MSIEDKYPGLYQGMHPLARASIDDLFGQTQCGACYGSVGNSESRLVYVFDVNRVAIVDGIQVIPLPVASLGNRRNFSDEDKLNLRFTFDYREYLMSGLTLEDFDLFSSAFLKSNEEPISVNSELSQTEVLLATTPFLPGYVVVESRGIVHAKESSVDLALSKLKKLAAECESNGVVGIVFSEIHRDSAGGSCEVQVLAYGTLVKIVKSSE
jgi:uncharacterized protein YbjQ (UPF0145 family)